MLSRDTSSRDLAAASRTALSEPSSFIECAAVCVEVLEHDVQGAGGDGTEIHCALDAKFPAEERAKVSRLRNQYKSVGMNDVATPGHQTLDRNS
jgi:hypothetical protein